MSSSSNASLLPPHVSNSSFFPARSICFKYRTSVLVFTTFSVTNILVLLPLCVLVLYLGVQRRRRRRSPSHSDIFTYNMVAMEVVGIFGCGLFCYGVCVGAPLLLTVGMYLYTATGSGEIPFHIFSCVERYLAVVYPITYQGLRKTVRLRNVAIGCVWLFSLGIFVVASLTKSTIPYICISVLSLAAISFSSVSVLRALIRPRPGEGGGGGDRVDQSKMRVFHMIMTIMGALLFRFGGHLLVLSVYISVAASERVRCGVVLAGGWFSLPSSLVLPLLFLHRAGKLSCCRNNAEPGSQ